MNPEVLDVLKSGAADKVADLMHKLAGPICDEVGIYFGDKFRAFRTKNLNKTLETTERLLLDAGLPVNPVPPRLFLPIIDHCSVEDNETLQDMWAGLLATASQGSDSMSPSFVDTLKQLTPDEARFLEKAYAELDFNLQYRRLREMPIDPYRYFIGRGAQPIVSPDNFERLGLIRREYKLNLRDAKSRLSQARDLNTAFSAIGEQKIDHQFTMTRYAVNFIEACRGPRKPEMP